MTAHLSQSQMSPHPHHPVESEKRDETTRAHVALHARIDQRRLYRLQRWPDYQGSIARETYDNRPRRSEPRAWTISISPTKVNAASTANAPRAFVMLHSPPHDHTGHELPHTRYGRDLPKPATSGRLRRHPHGDHFLADLNDGRG